MVAVESEKYLATADRIVHGARNEQYGHPSEDFARIAQMWSAVLGVDIAPKQVALLMILLKAGRLAHNIDHVDSWVDVAGYVGCANRIQDRMDGIG